MSELERALSWAFSSGVGMADAGRGVALRCAAKSVRKALSAAIIKGLLMVFSFER
jgi:hypothetical protein